jgi:hypothetical protein
MLIWATFFFFISWCSDSKLKRILPTLVDAHNKKVEQEKRGRKKTVSGDVFDVQNRVVSILHALLCIAATALQMRKEGLSVGAGNTQLQKLILSISAGYFFYDWVFCTLFSGTGALENLHHLATLVGLVAGIVCASTHPQIRCLQKL